MEKLEYVLEYVENHWKCWNYQLERLESVLELMENHWKRWNYPLEKWYMFWNRWKTTGILGIAS
ncbi:MAG: hypothetical protein PHX50_16380 [Massilibacteroides sp.]|nr:hypothetical protein [Massilibacteroides sp.]